MQLKFVRVGKPIDSSYPLFSKLCKLSAFFETTRNTRIQAENFVNITWKLESLETMFRFSSISLDSKNVIRLTCEQLISPTSILRISFMFHRKFLHLHFKKISSLRGFNLRRLSSYIHSKRNGCYKSANIDVNRIVKFRA